MEEKIKVFKAIADETRSKILILLSHKISILKALVEVINNMLSSIYIF